MGGTRAIWHDGWKAAALSPAAPDAWADYPTQEWELFDTDLDPSECHDVADQHPEKLQELIALWWTQAGQYNALPLENRGVVEILGTERPQIAKPRDRYVYYPGCAEVPESVAPNIRNRSYTIAVEADIETTDASGVLFSHGARFGGHALYIKDGKLKYVYNWVGMFEQIVESTEPITTGHARLLRLVRAGRRHDAGRGNPHAAHREDQGRRRHGSRPSPASSPSPARASTSARTAPSRSPMTTQGRSPWPFIGGTIAARRSSTSAASRSSISPKRRRWRSPGTEARSA